MSANVVDSLAWLEYFGVGHRAQLFETAVRDTQNLVVPVITIYEVFVEDFEKLPNVCFFAK